MGREQQPLLRPRSRGGEQPGAQAEGKQPKQPGRAPAVSAAAAGGAALTAALLLLTISCAEQAPAGGGQFHFYDCLPTRRPAAAAAAAGNAEAEPQLDTPSSRKSTLSLRPRVSSAAQVLGQPWWQSVVDRILVEPGVVPTFTPVALTATAQPAAWQREEKWLDAPICDSVSGCPAAAVGSLPAGCASEQAPPFCPDRPGFGWQTAVEASSGTGLWHLQTPPNLTGVEASCSQALAGMRQATAGFAIQSRRDAVALLAGKRVLFTGDSLIRGTFKEFCDYLGAPQIVAAAKDQRHTGAECRTNCTSALCKPVYVQYEWNAFGDYEPTRLSSAELGNCATGAGRPSVYKNKVVDVYSAGWDVVVLGTGLWHIGAGRAAPACLFAPRLAWFFPTCRVSSYPACLLAPTHARFALGPFGLPAGRSDVCAELVRPAEVDQGGGWCLSRQAGPD
eukprot:SAG22_NODE_1247_length_5014_cov_14.420142_2_plen_449_part_00